MGYDFGFRLPSERRIFDCTCTYILPVDLDRYGVANHKSNNDKTAQWLTATAITMIRMFKNRKAHTFKSPKVRLAEGMPLALSKLLFLQQQLGSRGEYLLAESPPLPISSNREAGALVRRPR